MEIGRTKQALRGAICVRRGREPKLKLKGSFHACAALERLADAHRPGMASVPLGNIDTKIDVVLRAQFESGTATYVR